MKFPLVTRNKHDGTVARVAELYARWLDAAANGQRLERELAELQFRYEQLDRREKNERLRRLRAEGLAAFKDDRIRGALQLLYREESGVKKAG